MVFVGGRRLLAVRPIRHALLALRRVATRRYDSPARLLPAGNTARIFSLEKMSFLAKNSLEKVDTIVKNSLEKVVIMAKNSFKKVDR